MQKKPKELIQFLKDKEPEDAYTIFLHLNVWHFFEKYNGTGKSFGVIY